MIKMSNNFFQCQKSYIVNKSYIEMISYKDNMIKMKGINTLLPIGRKYKNEMHNIFRNTK